MMRAIRENLPKAKAAFVKDQALVVVVSRVSVLFWRSAPLCKFCTGLLL